MAKRSNNYRLVGNVSADGKDHQSGYVVDRGAFCLHRTQDNGKVLSKSFVSGKLIIKGVIGNTPRQNRDNMRVFDRRGVTPCLKSHISKEPIMVIRELGD